MKLLITATLLFISAFLYAQENNDLSAFGSARYNEEGQFKSLLFNAEKAPLQADFLLWIRDHLRLNAADDFRLIKENVDKLGFHHFKFQRIYNDVPVEHNVLMVQV